MITEAKAMALFKRWVEGFDSQKEAAKSLEVSPQFLCDMLKRNRQIKGQMKKLGYEQVIYYRPINDSNGGKSE